MQRRFRRSVRRKLCNENLLQKEILGRRGSSAAGPGPAGHLFVPDELYELLRREKARQDRDEDRDERTRYNTYRSRALTFRVLFCLNFAILAGCFIGWWRSGEQEVYIQTAVPCVVLFIVGWITRIASDFYYDFKG